MFSERAAEFLYFSLYRFKFVRVDVDEDASVVQELNKRYLLTKALILL